MRGNGRLRTGEEGQESAKIGWRQRQSNTEAAPLHVRLLGNRFVDDSKGDVQPCRVHNV